MNDKIESTTKKPTLPKSLTTVTKASKLLALFLFVLLPFIGFYFGSEFNAKQQAEVIESCRTSYANKLDLCEERLDATSRDKATFIDSTTEEHNVGVQGIFIPSLEEVKLTKNRYWYKNITMVLWSYHDEENDIEYRIWKNTFDRSNYEDYSKYRNDIFLIKFQDQEQVSHSNKNDLNISQAAHEIELSKGEIKTERLISFYEIPTLTALGIDRINLVSLVNLSSDNGPTYIEVSKMIGDYPIYKTDKSYKEALEELRQIVESISFKLE